MHPIIIFHYVVSFLLPQTLSAAEPLPELPIEQTPNMYPSSTLNPLKVPGESPAYYCADPTHADKTIRPWDILLHQDGSIDILPSEKGGRNAYVPHYRIPAHTIIGLDEEEKAKRTERFALGSLIYEVMTASQPFKELSEDEVQDHYGRGTFPDDVFSMAMGPYILGCWSLEFEKAMEKRSSQVVGGVAMTASFAALPVLGLAGFAAQGPVLGSAAAAWQSSIGVVQAGSLFSWCQGAVMGGAAINGIVAGGAAGGGVAMAATGAAAAGGQGVLTPEEIKELFLKAYRKDNGAVEGAAML